MHALTPDECLQPEPDRSDRCAGPARPSVRPSVHGPRRFPSWRSNANVSAYAVPAFPWAKHCSSMASSWLMGMGSSWSGPLQFLRAACASKAVHVTVSEGSAKRPIFCRMLGSNVIASSMLVLVSPIQTNAETRAPFVSWIFLHIIADAALTMMRNRLLVRIHCSD